MYDFIQGSWSNWSAGIPISDACLVLVRSPGCGNGACSVQCLKVGKQSLPSQHVQIHRHPLFLDIHAVRCQRVCIACLVLEVFLVNFKDKAFAWIFRVASYDTMAFLPGSRDYEPRGGFPWILMEISLAAEVLFGHTVISAGNISRCSIICSLFSIKNRLIVRTLSGCLLSLLSINPLFQPKTLIARLFCLSLSLSLRDLGDLRGRFNSCQVPAQKIIILGFCSDWQPLSLSLQQMGVICRSRWVLVTP